MNKFHQIFIPFMLLVSDVFADPATKLLSDEEAIKVTQSLGSSQLVDTAVGLIIVLGIMLGMAWLVKRYVGVPSNAKGLVKVVGGTSLGPRERVVVVEVEGRRLLLGVAPGCVQMLHQLDHDDTQGSLKNDFSKTLETVKQESFK